MRHLRPLITVVRSPRTLALGAGWLANGVALAHDGHGLWGSHWHATDVLGFVATGAAVVAALWWGRK
jgi:hypothetical protein